MIRYARWMSVILILLWAVPGGPAFAQATTSIKCGNTIYEISTGTKAGNCGNGPNEANSKVCDDSDGNHAYASCAGGCGISNGAGTCTIKSAEKSSTKRPRQVKPLGGNSAPPAARSQ
jgi:hypothetical protein